jgi:uncharacterized membrane protein YcaP (DUF421 family)
MLLSSWSILIKTSLVAVPAYAALVFLLRISGKRTLSKWNAFDMVITVAIGSSLATTIVSKEVSLIQGVLAFLWLVVLQLVVTWISVRSHKVEQLVKSQPRLLLLHGKMLRRVMDGERVTESEIRAALRNRGITTEKDVAAVVLETDGSFSIIKQMGNSDSAMKDVWGYSRVSSSETAPAG